MVNGQIIGQTWSLSWFIFTVRYLNYEVVLQKLLEHFLSGNETVLADQQGLGPCS